MIEKIKGYLGDKNVQGGIAIAVVILIVFGLIFFRKPKIESEQIPTDLEQNTIVPTTPVKKYTRNSRVTKSLSYEEALKQYSALRIQLGSNGVCQANPNSVTYKNGTNIMTVSYTHLTLPTKRIV